MWFRYMNRGGSGPVHRVAVNGPLDGIGDEEEHRREQPVEQTGVGGHPDRRGWRERSRCWPSAPCDGAASNHRVCGRRARSGRPPAPGRRRPSALPVRRRRRAGRRRGHRTRFGGDIASACAMSRVWPPEGIIGHPVARLDTPTLGLAPACGAPTLAGYAFFRRGLEGRPHGAGQRHQHRSQGARDALRLSRHEHRPRAWRGRHHHSVIG